MATTWSRREVLVLGAASTLAACGGAPDTGDAASTATTSAPTTPGLGARSEVTVADLPPYEASPHFPEGILSGDPQPTSIVLWTRPSPALVASGEDLVAEVASAPSFDVIVATATATPDPSRDGATKLVIDGLDPGSSYVYRFRIGDVVSPVGLTRTAPEPDAEVDELRVAVFSCQRYTHGYFTAHADMADQAPDLVICLGDYVYNTGAADGVTVPGRVDPIQDAHTLEEFRAKYAHYRSDIDLQRMHSRSPLIAVPDNHDGAPLPGDDMYPGAHQAFFEKMPVRQYEDDELRTHRRCTWGRLLDIWMLDLHRFRTPGDRGSGNTDGDTEMMDPEVTYLGEDQRSWLFEGLADSRATWQVLGTTKQFSPLRVRADPGSDIPNAGTYINMEQWDGYQAERLAILDEVERLGRTGVVAVSGDMHWFWAADVLRDFDDAASPPIMVDLLCGGISSSNADERIPAGGPQTQTLLEAFGEPNRAYARYFEADRHGYGLITLRPDGAAVEYRSPRTIREPTSEIDVIARFRLDPSRAGIELVQADGWDAETGLPVGMVD